MTETVVAIPEVYDTDGLSSSYPIPFPFEANADVVVTHTNDLGVTVTLGLTTDYTIAGDSLSGFTVETNSVLPAGGELSVHRDEDPLQPQAFRDHVRFPARLTGDMGDRLARALQDVKARLERAIVVPPTEYGTPIDFGSARVRANYVPSFDANGQAEYLLRREDLQDIADNLALILLVGSTVPNIDTLSGVAAEIVVLAGIAQDIDDLGGQAAAIGALNAVRAELLAIHAQLTNVNTVGTDLLTGESSKIKAVADDLLLGAQNSKIVNSIQAATDAQTARAAAEAQARRISVLALRDQSQWMSANEGAPDEVTTTTAAFQTGDPEGPFADLGAGASPLIDEIAPKYVTRILEGRTYRLYAELDCSDLGAGDPAVDFYFDVLDQNFQRIAEVTAAQVTFTEEDSRVVVESRVGGPGVSPAEPLTFSQSGAMWVRPRFHGNPVSTDGRFRLFAMGMEDITPLKDAEQVTSGEGMILGPTAEAEDFFQGQTKVGEALARLGNKFTNFAVGDVRGFATRLTDLNIPASELTTGDLFDLRERNVGDGMGRGPFRAIKGTDFSALVAADTDQAVAIPFNGGDGSDGALIRQLDVFRPDMAGIRGESGVDVSAAFNRLIQLMKLLQHENDTGNLSEQVMEIPRGIYTIGAPLVADGSRLVFNGAGKGTFIDFTAETGSAWDIGGTHTGGRGTGQLSATKTNWPELRNMQIRASHNNHTSGAGVLLEDVDFPILENLVIENFKRELWLYNCDNGDFNGVLGRVFVNLTGGISGRRASVAEFGHYLEQEDEADSPGFNTLNQFNECDFLGQFYTGAAGSETAIERAVVGTVYRHDHFDGLEMSNCHGLNGDYTLVANTVTPATGGGDTVEEHAVTAVYDACYFDKAAVNCVVLKGQNLKGFSFDNCQHRAAGSILQTDGGTASNPHNVVQRPDGSGVHQGASFNGGRCWQAGKSGFFIDEASGTIDELLITGVSFFGNNTSGTAGEADINLFACTTSTIAGNAHSDMHADGHYLRLHANAGNVSYGLHATDFASPRPTVPLLDERGSQSGSIYLGSNVVLGGTVTFDGQTLQRPDNEGLLVFRSGNGQFNGAALEMRGQENATAPGRYRAYIGGLDNIGTFDVAHVNTAGTVTQLFEIDDLGDAVLTVGDLILSAGDLIMGDVGAQSDQVIRMPRLDGSIALYGGTAGVGGGGIEVYGENHATRAGQSVLRIGGKSGVGAVTVITNDGSTDSERILVDRHGHSECETLNIANNGVATITLPDGFVTGILTLFTDDGNASADLFVRKNDLDSSSYVRNHQGAGSSTIAGSETVADLVGASGSADTVTVQMNAAKTGVDVRNKLGQTQRFGYKLWFHKGD